MAVVADERALATVALRHSTLHMGGDMAPAAGSPGSLPGSAGRAEPDPFARSDDGIQTLLEYGGDITGRDLVAEDLLRAAQLVVRPPVEGDLVEEAVAGDRFSSRACDGWNSLRSELMSTDGRVLLRRNSLWSELMVWWARDYLH